MQVVAVKFPGNSRTWLMRSVNEVVADLFRNQHGCFGLVPCRSNLIGRYQARFNTAVFETAMLLKAVLPFAGLRLVCLFSPQGRIAIANLYRLIVYLPENRVIKWNNSLVLYKYRNCAISYPVLLSGSARFLTRRERGDF